MGRAPCCDKVGLKKGPWTSEEDQILVTFIHNHGHSNWRALPKQAGLLRCGKSCRLRWINYLKPDIKRGNFSREEEDSIIQLHEMLGNRWSAIAARLPGRTDNEIKNVWHTHLKKRLKEYEPTKSSSRGKTSKKSRANNNNAAVPTTTTDSNTSGGNDSFPESSSIATSGSPQQSSTTTTTTTSDDYFSSGTEVSSSVELFPNSDTSLFGSPSLEYLPIIDETFWESSSSQEVALDTSEFDYIVEDNDQIVQFESFLREEDQEKEAGANASVREYELIDEIKNFLEQACRGIVSCADIITLATRDAIALAGGPVYNVPTGRLDGLISRASEVNLPGPASTVAQIRQTFRARGMTVRDMVLLVGGGHSIGVAHCNFFQDRLFNFQGTGAPDSTMDTTLLNELQGLCGFSSQVPNPTTFLDQNTSFVLDNEIYKQMKMNRGILQIDQELALDPLSSKIVSDFAADNGFFRRRFVDAIIKMGNLPGSGGEVRGNCRRINSATAQQSLLSSI
ncbi:hypothetical protein SOVF_046550 [Spinacia oleracea]|nr:hypothetical protein SOVF_046550 [Spinacia oleracea]